MQSSPPRTLILGIGNVLWADEGFGIRCVEALHRAYTFADNVELMDGGTQGIYLMEPVQQAELLVLFDAIDYGLAPGTLKMLEDDAVPAFLGAKKMSLHQTGFQDVLAMARLSGKGPGHLLLVGVQPEELEDYGGSLRDCVKAALPGALELALGWLAAHGVHPQLREQPLSDHAGLHASALSLEQYESGRPSAEQAWRLGDVRFLQDASLGFDPARCATMNASEDSGGRRVEVNLHKPGGR